MPEGPEVETVRRTLEPFLIGESLGDVWLSEHALRRPFNLKRYENIKGSIVCALKRFGKLIWIETESRFGLTIRLGMTGRVRVVARHVALDKHTHLRLGLGKGDRELRYVDPRRFGEVCVISDRELQENERKKIGPDPFTWTAQEKAAAAKKLRSSNRPIKAILLDQSILSGVGNIYASEALFGARLHPETLGSALSANRAFTLLNQVTIAMENAIANGGTTFSSYVDGAGNKGAHLEYLQVFQRAGEPCKVCATPIARLVQSGRSTFFCHACQN